MPAHILIRHPDPPRSRFHRLATRALHTFLYAAAWSICTGAEALANRPETSY